MIKQMLVFPVKGEADLWVLGAQTERGSIKLFARFMVSDTPI